MPKLRLPARLQKHGMEMLRARRQFLERHQKAQESPELLSQVRAQRRARYATILQKLDETDRRLVFNESKRVHSNQVSNAMFKVARQDPIRGGRIRMRNRKWVRQYRQTAQGRENTREYRATEQGKRALRIAKLRYTRFVRNEELRPLGFFTERYFHLSEAYTALQRAFPDERRYVRARAQKALDVFNLCDNLALSREEFKKELIARGIISSSQGLKEIITALRKRGIIDNSVKDPVIVSKQFSTDSSEFKDTIPNKQKITLALKKRKPIDRIEVELTRLVQTSLDPVRVHEKELFQSVHQHSFLSRQPLGKIQKALQQLLARNILSTYRRNGQTVYRIHSQHMKLV